MLMVVFHLSVYEIWKVFSGETAGEVWSGTNGIFGGSGLHPHLELKARALADAQIGGLTVPERYPNTALMVPGTGIEPATS